MIVPGNFTPSKSYSEKTENPIEYLTEKLYNFITVFFPETSHYFSSPKIKFYRTESLKPPSRRLCA